MSGDDVRIEMGILVADDDQRITSSIGDFLKARGHRVYAAGDGLEAIEILKREAIDIVITDIKMPGMDGFEVLREVRRISPGAEVLVITGYGDIETAVQAMREGAFDFFPKPLDVQNLNASLQRTVRFQALRREKDRYRARLERIGLEARQRYGLGAIIGESPGIREVRDQVERVCESNTTTVLICGETGTGKELVARAIHSESARGDGPFVAVDCTSIPESLLESAFYGHEKGAFTDARETHKGYFEQADGGTLFLDEIGDMAPGMQVKLLRTLEERSIRRVGGSREIPVDVRVISVTNRDLPQAVNEGRFRKDLFYRLNVFAIHVPLLRERREDILPLAQYFLDRYAREMRKPLRGFDPDAEALLQAHPFPGNVRELRNLIERAAILCKAGRVMSEDLHELSYAGYAGEAPGVAPQTAQASPPDASPGEAPDQSVAIDIAQTGSLNLEALEREAIREAIRRSGGNKARAAELLGISRQALLRRMSAHGSS